MGMPGRARSRLKGDAGTLHQRWFGSLKERINPHRAGEPIRRTFDGRVRANSGDLHEETPLPDGLSGSPNALPLERKPGLWPAAQKRMLDDYDAALLRC
jgi:hypothetical protein